MMRRSNKHASFLLAAVFAAGCSPEPEKSDDKVAETDVAVFELPPIDNPSNEKRFANFEAFKATVYREPFPGGVYIVNGDTPIPDDDELRKFYSETSALKVTAGREPYLIVDAPGGKIAGWASGKQKSLTYCVSKNFGPKYDTVVTDMRKAASAWEEVADVKFVHLKDHDASCSAANQNVVFDVRPVNVGDEYLARAFFPRYQRPVRNLLINETSFTLNPSGKLQLVGILRHELGHVLGMRHEQTRPEAGTCFEDEDWKPLTNYDAFSVMHYPQCNGLGDWTLNLTANDRLGVSCFYGKAPESTLDQTTCKPIIASFRNPGALPYTSDPAAFEYN